MSMTTFYERSRSAKLADSCDNWEKNDSELFLGTVLEPVIMTDSILVCIRVPSV